MQSELRCDVVSESWESHAGLIPFFMLVLVLELEVVLVRLLVLCLMWAWLRQTQTTDRLATSCPQPCP